MKRIASVLTAALLFLTGIVAAQPATAAAHTAVFSCSVSSGTVTVTFVYHGSAGNIVYGDSTTFQSSSGFAINRYQYFYRKNNEWVFRTQVGGNANSVPSGQVKTWSGSDAALFNTSTDNWAGPGEGAMQVRFEDGVGSVKTCSSASTLVLTP